MRSGDVQRSCPLLYALLKQNPSEVFMTAHSSSTEGTVESANIELGTRRHFSDERHCKSQQVESSLCPQNSEKTRSQNLDYSGGIHPTLCRRQDASASLSVQPSPDNGWPVGDYTKLTDDQIQDLIAQWVADYSTDNHDMGTDPAPQSDSIMPKSNSVAHLPRTYATNNNHYKRQGLKYAVTEQCTISFGQAFEEDHSEGSKSNAGLTPKSRKIADCATSASKKHSTEYQQITGKVAATCSKNEDESAVVLTAVPGMTMDQWTKRQPSSSLNKNLDEIYQMAGVSRAVTHMPEREKGDAGLKPVEAIRFDSVQGVTDVSVDFQTKLGSVVSKNKAFKFTSLIESEDANAKKMKSIEDQHLDITSRDTIAHSEINLAVDKIQIRNVVSIPINPSEWLKNHRSHEGARKDVGSVHSKADVSIAHSDTKVKEQALLSDSKCKEALLMSIVKDPQYEDISDDEDMSQLATKFTPCYEDISEDENPQNEDVALERPSLVQEPEPNNEQLPFVNEGYGCVQMCAQMKTEVISDEQLTPNKHISPETATLHVTEHSSCQWLVETDDGFEDLGGQTSHSVSHSPSSVLKDEYGSDGQIDDEWIIIPISMSDIRFEPEDEDQDSPEKDVSHYASSSPVSPSFSTSPVPAFASCQEVEVFDTYDSFCREKAVTLQNTFQVTSDCSTPEHELDYEGEPNTLQSRRELYSDPEDSCETEDSCDYSPGSGHNIMTVSRECLKKRSVSLSLERDNSVTEKEDEKDRRKTLERLQHIIEAHAASKQNQHKTNGQKILESDTESDKNRKMKAKGKRLFPSGSDNSGDAECSQQKRHAPEIVDSPCGPVSMFQRNSLPPAGTPPPPPQHLSKLTNTQSKEEMQDACLESDIILVSDTEDDSELIGNQEETEKSGQLIEAICDSEHVQHNRQKISEKESDVIILSDTEDENDQNGKEEEIEKSGEVYEVKSSSEHEHHKTDRQKRKEEERRNVKGILSSGSRDSGDALPATKNICSTETLDRLSGTANKKPKNPRLSSEDQQEKQPQCVGLKVGSVLGPNPVVPRPLSQKSSHPTEYVKYSEVHMQANDETQASESPKGTGRDTDSRERNMPNFHSNKKSSTFKPDFANGRSHLTKNSVAKPCLASRQLSLPSHGAPSTSNCSLSSKSGQISEARQSSACSRGLSQSGRTSTSCSLPKSTQRISIPRHWSTSTPLLPRSYSSPSTLANPGTPTKRQSSSATKEKVHKDWCSPFILTKSDGKSNLRMEGGLRTTNYDSRSETSPGPRTMSDDSENEARPELRTTNNTSWHETRPGRRATNNNSRNEDRPGPRRRNRALRQRHESTTPLMKRAKIDAIKWTKATHRDVSGKERSSVGDHYKWSDKATANKPRKGFGR